VGGHLCSTLAHHRLTCLASPNNFLFYFSLSYGTQEGKIFLYRFFDNMLLLQLTNTNYDNVFFFYFILLIFFFGGLECVGHSFAFFK